ncbi:MAG: monofunctional biosynthetic peptidoglycan transglycosylase [Lautropia sp.]
MASTSRQALRGAARVAGIALLLLVAAVLLLQVWYLAQLFHWRTQEPPPTRFMREQLAQLKAADPEARLQYRWVDYSRQSVHLKRAVIAAEDANFRTHDGVDWDAMERAWDRNAKQGRVVLGASTITMQLVKNLFLSGERSYLRKAQELVLAFMIERVMDKRRILEIYLNVAEWGVGVFGAEAAARHHFGVSAAQLDARQAALLAAMLPRPRYHDRHRANASLQRRAALIQRRMSSAALP